MAPNQSKNWWRFNFEARKIFDFRSKVDFYHFFEFLKELSTLFEAWRMIFKLHFVKMIKNYETSTRLQECFLINLLFYVWKEKPFFFLKQSRQWVFGFFPTVQTRSGRRLNNRNKILRNAFRISLKMCFNSAQKWKQSEKNEFFYFNRRRKEETRFRSSLRMLCLL